mgnify:FL=1
MLVAEIYLGYTGTNSQEIKLTELVFEPFLDRHLGTLKANDGELARRTQGPV